MRRHGAAESFVLRPEFTTRGLQGRSRAVEERQDEDVTLGKRQDADMNAIEAPEPRERVASWWPWSAPRASRWRSTLGRGGLPWPAWCSASSRRVLFRSVINIKDVQSCAFMVVHRSLMVSQRKCNWPNHKRTQKVTA